MELKDIEFKDLFCREFYNRLYTHIGCRILRFLGNLIGGRTNYFRIKHIEFLGKRIVSCCGYDPKERMLKEGL